jgi:hypothetical protein
MWWLFVVAATRFRPDYGLTPRRTAIWLLVLLAHEYVLHVWRVLDNYTLSDVVDAASPG